MPTTVLPAPPDFQTLRRVCNQSPQSNSVDIATLCCDQLKDEQMVGISVVRSEPMANLKKNQGDNVIHVIRYLSFRIVNKDRLFTL